MNELPGVTRHKLILENGKIIFIKPVKLDLHESTGVVEITYEVKEHEQEKDSNVSKEANPYILSKDATDSNIST